MKVVEWAVLATVVMVIGGLFSRPTLPMVQSVPSMAMTAHWVHHARLMRT